VKIGPKIPPKELMGEKVVLELAKSKVNNLCVYC
jgi:hypothetical protein